MYRLLCLCLCLALGAPSCVNVAKVHRPATGALPLLRIANDSSGAALELRQLRVDVQVTGNIATTTFDLTFYNDRNQVLEGEFDFPLAEGQSVSRYALEINDRLREGVVVEKAKARVAFENTARRQVDPGLVEKTKGNHFRTRIYPIPAHGTRRVVIGIEQPLAVTAEGLYYALPLGTDTLEHFALSASVAKPAETPTVAEAAGTGIAFAGGGAGWDASVARDDFRPAGDFAFTIPVREQAPLVYTEAQGGRNYFYAWLPTDSATRPRPLPKTLTLFWDVSGSAAQRNLAKETDLLRHYLSALDNATVTVVPFAIEAYPATVFHLEGGHADEVLRFLQNHTDYDGGTQLGALDLQRYPADELWLLSDGISTFGKKEMTLPATPVTVVTSTAGADFSYLQYIAHQTGGRFVNLAAADAPAVATQLLSEHRQCIGAVYDTGAIDSLVLPVQSGLGGGLSVAGILKAEEATITLRFGYGNTVTAEQAITVRKGQGSTPRVAHLWAAQQVAFLDLRYARNKEAITSLGKRFGIVTQNTSLLVLDRVEDYVEQEIEPPADLLERYRTLLAEKRANEKDGRIAARSEAETAMNELVAWWKNPRPPATQTGSDSTLDVGDANLEDRLPPLSYSASVSDSVSVAAPSTYSSTYEVTTAAAGTLAPPAPGADGLADERGRVGDEATTSTPAIELHEWESGAPYLARLEAAPAAERYRTYLSLKGNYAQQPSFFIDAARFFHAQHDEAHALRVLSNVAELKLESPELLRNVAEQLQEFGALDLAVQTFEDVRDLREEEPQAYRDLALAYSEAGRYNEAVQLLYKVATGVWDERFGDIRQIALNEMNAIIGAHRAQVDVSGIDSQFIRALPVDVRIVIGWSADNSDIDLWVTDPRKEKCFYQHKATALGGRISRDATQGYGPEEFLLKKAANGDYQIEANLFGDHRQTLGGPITIKAELFTDFGRPTQQRKVISFRVTENQEVVDIGKLVFGKNG